MGSLRRVFLPLAAAGVIVLGAVPAVAQDYPTKAVKLIVPFAPGGSADLIARTVAAKLSDRFSQQVIG